MADRQVPEGGIIQTLEMPEKEPKQGIFTAIMNMQLKGAEIIGSETNTDTDDRMNQLVDWMISAIPNEKFRVETRKKRDERYAAELEKAAQNGATNQEKGATKKRISIETAGEIASYIDKYIGGERENRISFIIPDAKLRAWIQEHNPEHFAEYRKKEDKCQV